MAVGLDYCIGYMMHHSIRRPDRYRGGSIWEEMDRKDSPLRKFSCYLVVMAHEIQQGVSGHHLIWSDSLSVKSWFKT